MNFEMIWSEYYIHQNENFIVFRTIQLGDLDSSRRRLC